MTFQLFLLAVMTQKLCASDSVALGQAAWISEPPLERDCTEELLDPQWTLCEQEYIFMC